MCYPWRCPGRWPVCIQLYGHGAEAPIDGYCTRILAFRGLSACQGSLNSSKIVVNEMVLTCLKCPWIQCFQGIIRFWLDFLSKKAHCRRAWQRAASACAWGRSRTCTAHEAPACINPASPARGRLSQAPLFSAPMPCRAAAADCGRPPCLCRLNKIPLFRTH